MKEQRNYLGTREDRKINPVRATLYLVLLAFAAISAANWHRSSAALTEMTTQSKQIASERDGARSELRQLQLAKARVDGALAIADKFNSKLAGELAKANTQGGRAQNALANTRTALHAERQKRAGVNEALAHAVQKPSVVKKSATKGGKKK